MVSLRLRKNHDGNGDIIVRGVVVVVIMMLMMCSANRIGVFCGEGVSVCVAGGVDVADGGGGGDNVFCSKVCPPWLSCCSSL